MIYWTPKCRNEDRHHNNELKEGKFNFLKIPEITNMRTFSGAKHVTLGRKVDVQPQRSRFV